MTSARDKTVLTSFYARKVTSPATTVSVRVSRVQKKLTRSFAHCTYYGRVPIIFAQWKPPLAILTGQERRGRRDNGKRYIRRRVRIHFGNSYTRARTNDPYLCRCRGHRRRGGPTSAGHLSLALFSPFPAVALSARQRTFTVGVYQYSRSKGRSMGRYGVGRRSLAREENGREDARDNTAWNIKA